MLPTHSSAGLLDHREHAEALHRPCTGHLQELAPRRRARRGAADEAARLFVLLQLREILEVFRALHAQQQALCFDLGVQARHGRQNALMPVSSRPITNWCTVSVPS